MSVSYGGDSITFEDSSVISSGWTGFKNRLINGDMRVNQRGASVNVASGGGTTYSSCDRFTLVNYFGSGWINTEQSTDVPSGFTNSLKLTVGAAPPLSGSTGYIVDIVQCVEGNNIADLYGSNVTLSFWVKSSVTGTYSVTFQNTTPTGNDSSTRLYIAEYTISSANTWEKKTITVNLATGNASGTWNKTNGAGLSVCWNLGAESNRKGNTYLNTWGTMGSTPNIQSSSQVQWATNAGATFFITGAQLEKGSTASSFEYRPYGEELALCQRYYTQFNSFTLEAYQGAGGYVRALNTIVPLPVEMRATPTRTVITTGSNSIIRPTVTDYSGLNPVSSKHLNAFLETNNTTGTASISGRTESFSAEL